MRDALSVTIVHALVGEGAKVRVLGTQVRGEGEALTIPARFNSLKLLALPNFCFIRRALPLVALTATLLGGEASSGPPWTARQIW